MEGSTVTLRLPRRSDRGVYRALDDEPRPTSWRAGDGDDPWVGIDVEVEDHHGFAGPERYLYTIDNRDSTVVGRVQLDRIVTQHRRARVSVEVVADARGHGVGSDALRRLSDVGFDRLGLHKLWGEVRADDEAALRMADRCGFRIDSRRLAERFDHGRRHDVVVVSLLATDRQQVTS